jgi:hypothetical protein
MDSILLSAYRRLAHRGLANSADLSWFLQQQQLRYSCLMKLLHSGFVPNSCMFNLMGMGQYHQLTASSWAIRCVGRPRYTMFYTPDGLESQCRRTNGWVWRSCSTFLCEAEFLSIHHLEVFQSQLRAILNTSSAYNHKPRHLSTTQVDDPCALMHAC